MSHRVVVAVKMEDDMYKLLIELSALESLRLKRTVSVQELVRNALDYVFSDPEKIEEACRIKRPHSHGGFKQSSIGRPISIKDAITRSIKIDITMVDLLKDIAAARTFQTGRNVAVLELIRNALEYVYKDNDRLREAFRRSRAHITKRFKQTS